jgi:hypothetical protein
VPWEDLVSRRVGRNEQYPENDKPSIYLCCALLSVAVTDYLSNVLSIALVMAAVGLLEPTVFQPPLLSYDTDGSLANNMT